MTMHSRLHAVTGLVCAGALAGSITGVATTPLDVIKTRLMTQGSKRTYSGVIDCARKIGQQEGYATFLQASCWLHAWMLLVTGLPVT